MIRVLIADDHAVLRAGLERLLATVDDIEVVGTAADGIEASNLARTLQPDVVLMDLSMPGGSGLAATRRIRAAGERPQVVVLTSFSDREQILAALDAGALGYLLKDAEPDELMRAIRAAARGEAPLAPKAALTLIAERQRAPQSPTLSEREREVLALLREGLPNKLIARRMSISEKTVKGHLTSIFQRIGVSDRTQAALWAQQHGL